jgi:catechol 2,3-dioxygenase-like lactoylglutathione lyase family enzyme
MRFRFDCVFYYVSDLERSIRFYGDTLGFKLVSRDMVARFDIDGVRFEIVPSAANSKLPHGGNARLCLEVDSVQESLRELQSKGVLTGHAQSREAGVLGSFADPDGNEICLWQYLSEKPSETKQR